MIRRIIKQGDPLLEQVCAPVTEFDERLARVLDDMHETLDKAEGVGLAGPQIGYMRRVFIMHLGEGVRVEAINPKIVKTYGRQEVKEGCLSVPDTWGIVIRPKKCKLRAQNRHGEWYTLVLKDLGAQCACHENDHLDGHLFIEKVERLIDPEEAQA